MIKANTNLLKASLLAGLFISLPGCKDAANQQLDSSQSETPEQEAVAAPMNLNTQIALSKQDLAQHLDVAPESVVISGARQVTWRSGALGCPEPGKSYTEALVPGAVIFLQAGNMIYAYHAKIAGEPFYCPRERVEQPVHQKGADLT